VKKCSNCKIHELHLQTLALTIAAAHGRIDECRRLQHVPYKRLQGKHDICVNCLRHGWATMVVLGETITHPQDLSGRPLRTSRSDPSRDGGVWPAAPRESRAKTIFLIVVLAALALGSAALLTWRLG